jgi:hypothetical protein
VLGRFLSADPFMPGSLGSQAMNRFGYVGNSPQSLIDPTGFDDRDVTESQPQPRILPQCPVSIPGLAVDCPYEFGWRYSDNADPLLYWLQHEYRVETWVRWRTEMGSAVPNKEPPRREPPRKPAPTPPEEPQGEKPPCVERFLGDKLSQDYLKTHAANAWDQSKTDRGRTRPVPLGTKWEAARNAEHYLWSYTETNNNSYMWGPMLANTVLYNAGKFWANTAEYWAEKAGVQANVSPFTYTSPTHDELLAGFAGANDALFGRPNNQDGCSQN